MLCFRHSNRSFRRPMFGSRKWLTCHLPGLWQLPGELFQGEQRLLWRLPGALASTTHWTSETLALAEVFGKNASSNDIRSLCSLSMCLLICYFACTWWFTSLLFSKAKQGPWPMFPVNRIAPQPDLVARKSILCTILLFTRMMGPIVLALDVCIEFWRWIRLKVALQK